VCHISNKALDTFTDYIQIIEYGKQLLKIDKKKIDPAKEKQAKIFQIALPMDVLSLCNHI